ncbi:MAG: nitroreductase [Hyphomicrobiales bacterium]|nr:MAG: nitroreductase [Hyphomicrobiales bacterium]
MNPTLDLLLSRRSALTRDITAPGPDPDQLETILTIGARVPDHGKLTPWRFVVVEGEAMQQLGEVLQQAYDKAAPEPEPRRREAEGRRFADVPVVIFVVSRDVPHIKIPRWEQILSAGAVCQNMLIAAKALGYAAQWTSDWLSYDRNVLEALGLGEDEQVAGVISIGTTAEALEERPRPALADIVTYWSGARA